MLNGQHTVFISYAWGGESETVANEIDQAVTSAGINLIKDKRNLGFKGLIKEFMEEIGQGNAVILVISDKYLKSPNCMFELLEVQKSGDFYERVFPLVLPDAAIYKSTGIISYVKFWEDQIDELNEAIKGLDSFADTQGIRDDIDLFTDIRGAIAKLATTFRNMNTLTIAEMRSKSFAPLLELLGEKVSPKPASSSKPNSKYGKVLYHIPELMQIQEWTRCIVRLAWDELLLKENLKLPAEEQVIDDIRLGEVMQVSIEEGRDGDAFDIKSLSSTEQVILVDDYTEWLFDIKALREGTFTVVLRVTLLQLVEGFGERKKDIVLERNVTTKALAPEPLPVFEAAAIALAKPSTKKSLTAFPRGVDSDDLAKTKMPPLEKYYTPEPIVFATPSSQPFSETKKPKSTFLKILPYAASISLLIAVAVFVIPNFNKKFGSSEVASLELPNTSLPTKIETGAHKAFEMDKLLLVIMDPSQANLPESEQTVLLFLVNNNAIDSMRLDSMNVKILPAQDTIKFLIKQLRTSSALEIEDSVKHVRRTSGSSRLKMQVNSPGSKLNRNN